MFRLDLNFVPVLPIPTSFSVTTTFNDTQAKIGQGVMDPISLDFEDLLLPTLIPDNIDLVS
jgi:hypothetical protein